MWGLFAVDTVDTPAKVSVNTAITVTLMAKTNTAGSQPKASSVWVCALPSGALILPFDWSSSNVPLSDTPSHCMLGLSVTDASAMSTAQ